jgi:2-hydroxychromene-2-carboxylate isomerase
MGLRIRPPQPFEVDFTAANRAAIAAARDGFGLSFALAAADARWGAGADVSDFSVLEKCAADCGWRADAVRNAQTDRAVTDEIKAHRALIEEDQAFGVPFAVFGDNKYWGHERFDILVEDVAQAKA